MTDLVEIAPAAPGAAESTATPDRRCGRDPGERRGRIGRFGARGLALAVLLGTWWLVAALDIWPDVFVPDPDQVFNRLIDGETVHQGQKGLSGYYLHEHLGYSLLRIVKGVGLAIPFGVILGLLLATVRPFQIVFEPYVNFVRSLPPLAYFSLLIIWFGIEDTSKVWLLFLAAFPPIALSVVGGVRGIRTERLQAARSLGANRLQTIRFVVLPSVLPELFTGIRLAIGFAWTTIVAAETVNGIPGIGGLAWSTKKFQQTDVAVLSIIIIGLSAIALDLLVKNLERRAVPWQGRA
ncbi:MAG TPA: ABC transporter permease [Solirubrobacteraceae bacterium]|jgi:taurine transport system permease protein